MQCSWKYWSTILYQNMKFSNDLKTMYVILKPTRPCGYKSRPTDSLRVICHPLYDNIS